MHVYAGVLAYYENYILFIQEEDVVNSKKANKWSFPGGGPDSDDLALEAAREFDEETYGIVAKRDIIYNKLKTCEYYDDGRIRIYYLPLKDIADEDHISGLNKVFNNVYSFLNNNCVKYNEYKAIICENEKYILLETKDLNLLEINYICNNLHLLRVELKKDFLKILKHIYNL